jgi:hypothetical protein
MKPELNDSTCPGCNAKGSLKYDHTEEYEDESMGVFCNTFYFCRNCEWHFTLDQILDCTTNIEGDVHD